MAFTSAKISQDMSRFIDTKVKERKLKTAKSVQIVLEVLKEVFSRLTIHEPRFNHIFQMHGERIEGVHAIATNHIEVRIYLDQIEMFRAAQNGAPDGACFLDLKEEMRKDCCIWSEFITAAGHLSARKVREKFQMILHQAVQRTTWIQQKIYVTQQKSCPRLCINDEIIVDIFPSFRCVKQWPMEIKLRTLPLTKQQKSFEPFEFELIAKEVGSTQPYSTDRDAWYLDFSKADSRFMQHENRRLCLSILKSISSRNWQDISSVVTPFILRTVFMYICEKQTKEEAWSQRRLPDRINSVLLQLVACLQSRCLPHYYLKGINLLEGKSSRGIRSALEEIWKFARQLCTNQDFFLFV